MQKKTQTYNSNFPKLVLACLISLFLVYLVESKGHRQKFGEVCSRGKKCDFTKWLRCSKGKCVCYQTSPDYEDLYYDPHSERCVGKGGSNCSMKFYPFDDEEPHLFHLRGVTTNHWRYGNGTLRCGSNAFCDYDGKDFKCNCRKHYYQTDEGRCLKLKSYGDSCSTNKECDPDAFLQCNKDTCGCEGEHRIYDPNLNKCTVLAGQACTIRHNRLDKRKLDDCTVDSFCEEQYGACRCELGTQIHSDKSCQRGFGQECDHDNPCGDSTLSCRSKVCQCKYPLHMKYNEDVQQCVGIASGPCDLNITSEMTIKCTTNAKCVQNGLFTECKCQDGFLQTDDGDCVKTYGSPCLMDSDCDRVGPLACINSHCECEDLLLSYDPVSRKCKGLVGSRCKLHEDSCVENASCNPFTEITKGNFGKCACNPGFKETANRTCYR